MNFGLMLSLLHELLDASIEVFNVSRLVRNRFGNRSESIFEILDLFGVKLQVGMAGLDGVNQVLSLFLQLI